MSDTILTGTGQTDPGQATQDQAQQPDQGQTQQATDDRLYDWTAQVKKDALIDDLKGKQTLTDFVKHYQGVKEELEKTKTSTAGLVKPPGEDASAEEVSAYRQAIGVPETPAKYDLKTGRLPAGVTVSEEDMNEYRQLAYETGLTQAQAQSLLELDLKRKDNEYQSFLKERQAGAQEALKELKLKYGDKYEEKLNHGLRMLAKLGGEELKEELEISGLGNNKHLIDFIVKVSDNYSEDGFIIGGSGGSSNVNLDSLYSKSMNHLSSERRR